MEGTIKNSYRKKDLDLLPLTVKRKIYFFHGNELKDVKYEELKVGDRVSFEKTDSEKGPNATNVTRIQEPVQ